MTEILVNKIAAMVMVTTTLAILVTAGTLQNSFADGANNAKVVAIQNGEKIDEETPGLIFTDTTCLGGVETDTNPVKMTCYLIPPGVSNDDHSNAVASFDDNVADADCQDQGGFNGMTCFSVLFDGSWFTEPGDYHFHAEFYDSDDEIIPVNKGQNDHQFKNNSFMVVPESPVGMIAILVSSLAAFGSFVYLKSRRNGTILGNN